MSKRKVSSIADIVRRRLDANPPRSNDPREIFNGKLCAMCNKTYVPVRYFAKRKSYPYCNPCHAAHQREWRKANPLSPEARRKDNCRSYAGVYLRRGKIKREPCKVCGSHKSQMHHPDYDKPLEVEWMCRPCHLLEHHIERNRAAK